MKHTSSQLSDELNYANRILDEFWKEDDRAAAILVAAEMDRVLLSTLSNFLLEAVDESSPLVDRDGPLEAFASRIELAYRVGLIPPVIHNDLHAIRRIRNAFAHAPSGLSFDDPSISKHTKRLISGAQELGSKLGPNSTTERKEGFYSPRNIFRLTASLLLTRLSMLQFQVSPAVRQWEGFFETPVTD